MKPLSWFCWTLCLILTEYEVRTKPTDQGTLILLHVLFRHGNRTPNGPEELYPRDPYLNEKYYPFGLGQLTNAGKRGEYYIGQRLRERYRYFLPESFNPEEVDPRSTDYNRTKMSLELVLASLYPPKGDQIWYPPLNWQPIPYNYWPALSDQVLMGNECPYYKKLYNETIKARQVQGGFKKYKENFDYISENTGLSVTKFQDVYNLFFGLKAEEDWGFRLPIWTRKVWPKIITNLAAKEYSVMTATTDLVRMGCGYFLEKIIGDTIFKIRNPRSMKKLYLYSAHENNIGELLSSLGIFHSLHVPNYGSYVVFEIHRINKIYGIKIYYENYVSDTPQLLKLPSCKSFCPFEQFQLLTEEYMPTPNLCFRK